MLFKRKLFWILYDLFWILYDLFWVLYVLNVVINKTKTMAHPIRTWTQINKLVRRHAFASWAYLRVAREN